MDRHIILDQMGLAPVTSLFFTGLTFQQWGRDLLFAVEADQQHFEVTFHDCREMKWQIYTHQVSDNPIAFPRSEWVNFRIGRDQHRSPAHILSEHFGLSLVYGALSVSPKNQPE